MYREIDEMTILHCKLVQRFLSNGIEVIDIDQLVLVVLKQRTDASVRRL